MLNMLITTNQGAGLIRFPCFIQAMISAVGRSRLRALMRKFGAKRLAHPDPRRCKRQSQTEPDRGSGGWVSESLHALSYRKSTMGPAGKGLWQILSERRERFGSGDIYLYHNSIHSVCSDFYLSDFKCNSFLSFTQDILWYI